MQSVIDTNKINAQKVKINTLLGNQYTNSDHEVTKNQKNYYTSCRRMLEIEIRTEDDCKLLELMEKLLEASVEVNTAIITHSQSSSPDNYQAVISKNEALVELIKNIKDDNINSVYAGKRALLIQRIALLVGFFSYFTIAFAFSCLAPDLFLIGFCGGALPALLGGFLIAGCIKDNKVFSLISQTEDATNRRNKTFSKFFENSEQTRIETREDVHIKTVELN